MLPNRRLLANLGRPANISPTLSHFMGVSLLFFFLSTVAILSAVAMLLARNPVNSALWLVLHLFCIAGLYLTLNATFIAVVQVLVYAGAIMVLFLFVIMLLNLSAGHGRREFSWRMAFAYLLGVIVLAQVSYVIASGANFLPESVTMAAAAESGSPVTLAKELFTRYALLVEVIGMLLLAATIGAVVLARKKEIV